MNTTKIIAHRGASGYAPENTISAFQKALEFNVHGIELDVHMSYDGYLIVCHDEGVDRTTNGKGLIKDLTLNEIKSLDAGGWFSKKYSGQRIPTLQEVLDLIGNKGIFLNIELKSGPIIYPNIEREVINVIEDYGLSGNTIISSFNHYSLLEVKRIKKTIKTAPLYMAGIVSPWKYARDIGADGIHPYFYNVTPQLVKLSSDNGIFVNTFTVDDPNYIKYVIGCGVAGVMTNYPDRGFSALEEIQSNNFEREYINEVKL
ncbi:glycerophosphodiester phosphodiesterase [Alkaliphilus pronyensis]|uniref:Glycerophosphodiester phosphodiesterase n=1 Tax=Alkaliphilus pronyensis TaxID=1482732 RepID=A0A6I0F8F9_9FIRM|nr:glycerophosphodiester phosphodiesterase [Alkaliphilus pronyensis]KAB3534793.1 glycerophosphodiester phosphodiesterase [Alkaliphilus pronyensis]